MNDEQLEEIREGNLNCVRLHLWLRQKQQLLQIIKTIKIEKGLYSCNWYIIVTKKIN